MVRRLQHRQDLPRESKQSLTATPTILNWRKNYLIVTTRMTKPIVLKAGIKENATQNLQTTRVPEYDASYDDNDDLTIIYEEIKYGGNTVQFGFVGESGQLLNPADFKVTTEVVQIIDGVSTVLDNISATDQTGNLKAMTIPQNSTR